MAANKLSGSLQCKFLEVFPCICISTYIFYETKLYCKNYKITADKCNANAMIGVIIVKL